MNTASTPGLSKSQTASFLSPIVQRIILVIVSCLLNALLKVFADSLEDHTHCIHPRPPYPSLSTCATLQTFSTFTYIRNGTSLAYNYHIACIHIPNCKNQLPCHRSQAHRPMRTIFALELMLQRLESNVYGRSWSMRYSPEAM